MNLKIPYILFFDNTLKLYFLGLKSGKQSFDVFSLGFKSSSKALSWLKLNHDRVHHGIDNLSVIEESELVL